MEKVNSYVSGRVSSILKEIDSYEKEAQENEARARILHGAIGEGIATESDVKEFLGLEYDTHQNMQMLKNLLITLKSFKTMADSLSIDLIVEDNHKEIFDHIQKDTPYLFTFKSGKKEFVNDTAEQAYNEGLKRYQTKANIDRAMEQIKSQASVDNKQ